MTAVFGIFPRMLWTRSRWVLIHTCVGQSNIKISITHRFFFGRSWAYARTARASTHASNREAAVQEPANLAGGGGDDHLKS